MTWLPGWSKRIKLTIDHLDISADLTNFPMLLHLSTSCGRMSPQDDLTFVFTEIVSDANRFKIAITTSDGTTECKVEIEKWDSANKQAWLWVKAPSILTASDTDFYLYYDHNHANNTASVGDPESTPAAAVWDSNFKIVLHMQDYNTSNMHDSTTNNEDISKKGAGEPAVTTGGKVDVAQSFDGSNDYTHRTTNSFQFLPTLEFWLKTSDTDAWLHEYSDLYDYYGWDCNTTAAGKLHFQYTSSGGGVIKDITSATTITDNVFHHLAIVDNGTNLIIYFDGVSDATVATGTPQWVAGMRYYMGLGRPEYTGHTYCPLAGIMDEVRISNTARTAAWIKATYETGRDHLLDWGSEETKPAMVIDKIFLVDRENNLFRIDPSTLIEEKVLSVITYSIAIAASNGIYNVEAENVAPVAYYYNGKTYYAYQGPTLDPYVGEFTHSTKIFATPVVAGDNPLSGDGHGSPSLIRDDDGYIHVFFGSHNTAIKHSRSNNPDNISAWTAQTNLQVGNYPCPIRTGTNTFYLFYRSSNIGTYRLIERFRKTTDNFSTFGAATDIIDFGEDYDIYHGNFDFDSTNGRIHFVWFTYRNSNGTQYAFYHAYLDTASGNCYSMDGTNLGAVIDKTEADAHCLIANFTTTAFQPFSKVHLDSSNYPYFVYFDGAFKFIKWTGAWSTPTTIYSAVGLHAWLDFIITNINNFEVYIIKEDGNLYKFASFNGGATWDSGTQVTFVTARMLRYPWVVKDYQSIFKVLVTEIIEDVVTPINLYGYGEEILLG